MELVQNEVKWASAESVTGTLTLEENRELTIKHKPWLGKEVVVLGGDRKGVLHIVEDVLRPAEDFTPDSKHGGFRIVVRRAEASSGPRSTTVDIHEVRDAQ